MQRTKKKVGSLKKLDPLLKRRSKKVHYIQKRGKPKKLREKSFSPHRFLVKMVEFPNKDSKETGEKQDSNKKKKSSSYPKKAQQKTFLPLRLLVKMGFLFEEAGFLKILDLDKMKIEESPSFPKKKK